MDNNIEKTKEPQTLNNSSSIKPKDFKEFLMYGALEIFKYIFMTHFWGAVFLTCILGVGYLQFSNKINVITIITLLFGNAIDVYQFTTIFLLLFVLFIGCYCLNKVISLIHMFELTNKIDETLSKEYSSIRDELNNFIKILMSLQSFCVEISKTTDQILKGLVNDNVDIKNIYHELISISEVMHNIPNREMSMKMLTLRTQMIYVDAADKIIKYIADHSTIRRIMTIDENSNGVIIKNNIGNRNKNSYIDQRLIHDFNEIKNTYISDIYAYSKNTLDVLIKNDIKEELDKVLDSIINMLLYPDSDTPLELEAFFYNMHYEIKNMSDRLINMYANNLTLPEIFNIGFNNVDKECATK